MSVELSEEYLWGNPLVAVDIETTGRDPSRNEICQIALVPLTMQLEVCRHLAFVSNVCPLKPEDAEGQALSVHGFKMEDLLAFAPVPSTVIRHIVSWWEELPKQGDKRLVPLAHNWAFEKSFLVPFFGIELFDTLFHPHARDTLQMATLLNDRACLLGRKRIFKYLNLSGMCSYYKIQNNNPHDAYADALVTAQLYRAMLTDFI